MSDKAYLKPTKQAYIVGIIVAIFFLLFAAIFFYLMVEERSVVGQLFLLFFMLMLLLMIGVQVYNLRKYNSSSDMTVNTIEMPDFKIEKKSELPFDEKLRKLEQLKRDGLLSTEEYEAKRSEILNEKW
jgi:hypothetical protein